MSTDSTGRSILIVTLLTIAVATGVCIVAPFTVPPRPEVVALFVASYLSGMGYLGIGVWVLVHHRQSRVARLLALLGAQIAILFALTVAARRWESVEHLRSALLPTVGMTLVLLGAALSPRSGMSGRACLALGSVTLAMVLWGAFVLPSRSPLLASAQFLFSGASLSVFGGFLLDVAAHPPSVRRHLQARVVLHGVSLAFLPAGIQHAALLLSRLCPIPCPAVSASHPILYLPTVLFPLSVAYTVFRYHSLDTDLLATPFYFDRQGYCLALRDFSRDLAADLELDHFLTKLLSYVGRMLHARRAIIMVVSPSDVYEVRATWGDVGAEALQAVRFTPHDRVIARLQREGQSLLLTPETIQDIPSGEEERARLECLDAVLLVPLRAQDHLLGVLALGEPDTGEAYSIAEIALADAMAAQVAVAAENALLYARQVEQEKRLMRQTRRLTDILSLGNLLKSLDREVVLQSTVDAVRQSLGFGLVMLSLVEEDDPGRVRVVAWSGVEGEVLRRLSSTPMPLIDPRLVPDVQKLGHCYFICAPGSDPGISIPGRPVPWHDGDQLFVPLTSNEELLGYLTVDRPEDGLRPGEDTLEMLEIFANQAAIAIQNANLYDNLDRALDERVAELATLQEIDRQINARLDFDHVMAVTLEWAMRVTAAVAGTLSLVSPDRRTLRVVAHRGYPPEMDEYWSAPWPVDEGIIGQVVRTGRPAMVADVARNAEYSDLPINIRSHLVAPITREETVIGVISLESDRPNGFSADNLAFLTRFADHAAIAIENVLLYEQTNRRVAELSALQKISLDLTSSLNLSAVLDSIAANTLTLTQADRVSIYLYDRHEDALIFGTGLSQRGREERPPVPVQRDVLTATVARRGEAIVINDAREHPLVADSGWQVGAIAGIPLRKAGRTLGVFDISFKEPHLFTADELRVLHLLADQAAIAVENAQLFLDVQRANDAKTEFVNIVSHELKVPMTSIQGYARLLLMGAGGPVTDQQKEFINVILRNVERMSALVSDLLDLARIEAGRIRISPRPVSLSKVVQEALRSVEAEIARRKHKVEVDVPPDLPEVLADPMRLMQVLINLLSNAYKYTPDGGRIRVWAEVHGDAQDGKERWVVCAVQDSGVGIASQDLERIFQPFTRVQNPQTGREAGTGLGLSITRSIVELHGGHIWVESEPGKGSTFYFTLPLAG